MKHVKNIAIFLAMWGISYYFGYHLGAAYDGVRDGKDLVSIIAGIGGLVWIYQKYGK